MKAKMILTAAIAGFFATAADLSAQNDPGPSNPTVRFMDIPRIVERVAAKVAEGKGGASVIIWALDVDDHWDKSVKEPLAKAVRAVFDGIEESDRPRMAIATYTEKGIQMKGKLSRSPNYIADAMLAIRPESTGLMRDLMSGLKTLSGAAPRPYTGGRIHVVLLSLENVDSESGVETTLDSLRSRGVILHVIGKGAFHSDSYWTIGGRFEHFKPWIPRNLTPTGTDGPIRELPVGFVFQINPENRMPPAGHGPWAYCRLAAMTGGAYYSFYPDHPDSHFCMENHCIFCEGKSNDCLPLHCESYLGLFRPDLRSRSEFLADACASPIWFTVKSAWDIAAKAGVTMTVHPGFEPVRFPESPCRAMNPEFGVLMKRLVSGRWHNRAAKAGRAMAQISSAIALTEKAYRSFEGKPVKPMEFRARAVLCTLEAQLKTARFNLYQYRLFCLRNAGRDKTGGHGDVMRAYPNNEEVMGDSDLRVSNVFFCQGSEPVRGLNWLNGKDTEAFLDDLCGVVDRNLRIFARTPYETANRWLSLSLFRITPVQELDGTVGLDSQRKRKTRAPKEKEEKTKLTAPKRPSQGGASSRPSGGAVATGGGR